MIGISVYLNDPLAEKRLAQAKEKGVTTAFTSLHIPEERGDLADKARRLLQLANQLGIEVYADVSAKTPSHLGISSLDELSALGVAGLRLDDFFDQETILALSNQYHIALNASIMFEDELLSLLDQGMKRERLIGWHNFYPRRETGLDDSFFLKQCEMYRKYEIPVAAFVAGRGEKRGPLYEGLPTLERHRTVDPFVAAVELLQMGVSHVYIGDPEPGDQLLEQLSSYDKHRVMVLRVRTSVLQNGEYRLRPDFSRDVLRFMDTRSTQALLPQNTVERPKGSVTMDNGLYGRYCGEMQITLRDLQADERVNVVGEVIGEDLPLLSLIQPGQNVYLKCEDM